MHQGTEMGRGSVLQMLLIRSYSFWRRRSRHSVVVGGAQTGKNLAEIHRSEGRLT